MALFTTQELIQGQVSKESQPVWKKSGLFNAQSPAGAISDQSLGEFGGALSAVRVKMGSTAPDTLTITIKDSDGIIIATGTLTADGELTIASPIVFVGGLTISISGNTTVNATATISLYFF